MGQGGDFMFGTDIFWAQGGVATGKSTVSNMLRELGIPVIDADAMARRYYLSSST